MLTDQPCTETCWHPATPTFNYKPCGSVIDNYGLLWVMMQPLEWMTDALFSPWELNRIENEMTPMHRTERSCFYYSLVTQIGAVAVVLVGLWISILIFTIQLPSLLQPFIAACLEPVERDVSRRDRPQVSLSNTVKNKKR